MKVLLLVSKPFLPVIDGGNEASRALALDLISAEYEIKALTFSSEKHPFHPKEFQKDKWKELQMENFPISLKINPFKALLELLSGQSYNLSRFSSKEWLTRIKAILNADYFDIVLFDGLFSSGDIEFIKSHSPKSKFILRAHNVESNIWREKADKEPLYTKRKYLSLLANQLEKREKEILSQMDGILPISDDDLQTFQNWGFQKTSLLPYFPNIGSEINDNISSNFFFLGAMNWQPNVEAHDHLVHKLFPKILTQLPNVLLSIAGGNQDILIKSNNSMVQYKGFVIDKEGFIKNSGILLAPIQSGSGVRIKIIEAMALGVPVVTTQLGAAGIPFENGNGIYIAKNDDEFIDFACQLSQNESLRKEISIKALTNIKDWKNKFDLKSIFEGNG